MNKVKIGVVLLLCTLIIGSLTIFAAPEKSHIDSIENPKQQPDTTITSIAKITQKHLIENAILDLQVTPTDDKEQVLLKLQTTEFLTEDMLQKNTYNLLQDLRSLSTIHQITIAWYMPLKGQNTEVLSITLNEEALKQVTAAIDFPTIATSYTKHASLKASR